MDNGFFIEFMGRGGGSGGGGGIICGVAGTIAKIGDSVGWSKTTKQSKLEGGFPIEIKTKIRYHTLWNYDNIKYYDILFWL